MERTYIEDKDFEKVDFSIKPWSKGEYDNCTFTNCNLSEADLSNSTFSECSFDGCNLSMAKLMKTAFRDCTFRNCKLLGLHFEDCDDFLFAVQFEACMLHLSSFYNRKLKKMLFKNCNLQEVDFTGADLSNSFFDNCDLAGAVFDNTILEKADFRTAYHYAINPEANRIKKAKFSTSGIAGLLHQYDIEIE